MKSTLKTNLLGAVSFALLTATSQGTVVFTDTFDSGTGSWFTGGSTGTLLNTSGQLDWSTSGTNNETYNIGRSFSSQTIAVGETIRLTMDYTQNAATASDIIRVGLFDVTNAIAANEWSTGSGAGAFSGYYGFIRDIWYQGESNAGQPLPYQKLLPAMIADWRTVWGKDLPFLFVQIAPHRSIHPSFREAQQRIWQSTPNTAMVVTTDVGNANNIHPTKKRPIGERLAAAARAISYGERITYSGPIFESMKIVDNRALISFKQIGDGLLAKGETLTGFTIAGDDGKFLPGTAVIEGDKVVITSAKTSKPSAVRYNWAIMPDGNLFNRNGLPATPFRSDQPGPSVR